MEESSPTHADVTARRRRLRAIAVARREGLEPEVHQALTGRIEQHLDELLSDLAPHVLAFCWPHRAEPDLRRWADGWRRRMAGHQLALPVVQVELKSLVFRTWVPGEPLAVDCHGIPFPAGGNEVVPDVVLVPLNAFDSAGYRLGYGGGYFDRTLAQLRMIAVGVGFELGRVENVLPQPHDCPMNWLVTEMGVFHPHPSRSARA